MSSVRKKILWITWELPYFPGGGGGSTRQFCLIRELSQHYDVYLVTALEASQEKYLSLLQPYCKSINWHINPSNQVRGLRYPLLLQHNVRAATNSPVFKYTFSFCFQMICALLDFKPLRYYHTERVWLSLNKSVFSLLSREHFDLIHFEHADIAHWAEKIMTQTKKTVTAQNVKSLMHLRYARIAATPFKKILAFADGIKYFLYEKTYLKKLSKVFVMSKDDQKILHRIDPRISIAVIENGVDTAYFSSDSNSPAELNRAVFVGSLHYQPNQDGAYWWIRKILPLLNHPEKPFFFDVVGINAPDRLLQMQSNHIKVYGNADDIRPAVAQAAFFVVPLRSGSGTRLKILDAMAMGKVVISTTLGAEGIDCTHNENIMIANTEKEFVDTITSLQSQPERIRRIGLSARKFVENSYDWKLIGDRLHVEIEKMIGN